MYATSTCWRWRRPRIRLHACWGYPAAVRVGRDPGQVDAPRRQLDEKQHVEALQEQRIDGEKVAFQDARRLLTKNSAQFCSSRLGAGSIRASFRIVQTVLAASWTPSPTSSPWIRRYPQPRFSRAIRTTSSRTAARVGGSPGRRHG